MSYGLMYTIPFAALNGDEYVVEIEKRGYTGTSTELVGGASPFIVKIDEADFIYTASRFSTATISIVGNDYLRDLYSIDYQQFRVTLKRNKSIEWCGFIKPELYTQDYSARLFELELECISAMSIIEYINYTPVSGDSKKFVSLWEVIKKCIESSNAKYRGVYIPHVYARDAEDYADGRNIIDSLLISEQNFFDEEDKAMTLKEVLDEVCKFLHWTCVDYKGDLYFVDVDHRGEYIYYSSDLSMVMGRESFSLVSIQDVGIAGSSHTLDIISGANKCSMRTSNYPVGKQFQVPDFKKLKVLWSDGNRFNVQGKNYSIYKRHILEPAGMPIELIQYDKLGNTINIQDYSGEPENVFGALPMLYASYTREEKKETGQTSTVTYSTDRFDYQELIRIRLKNKTDVLKGALSGDIPILRIKGIPSTYNKGAFSIYTDLIECFDNNLIPDSNKTGTDAPNLTRHLKASLRVGDKYFSVKVGTNIYGTGGLSKTWLPYPDDTDIVSVNGVQYTKFFKMGFETNKNDASSERWERLFNQKTPELDYEGARGFIAEVPDLLYGDLEFTLYSSRATISNENPEDLGLIGFFLKDFKFSYHKKEIGVGQSETDGEDRVYENVINSAFINELDEIELKISSYNDDGACFGKVIMDGNYLTDNIYSYIEGATVRPEELLIRRITRRYSAPQIKLTQVLINDNSLVPTAIVSDAFMGDKNFINIGGDIDYRMNVFKNVMIEI